MGGEKQTAVSSSSDHSVRDTISLTLSQKLKVHEALALTMFRRNPPRMMTPVRPIADPDIGRRDETS